MTTVAGPIVQVHWHHPEWVVVGVATGGWAWLLVAVAADPSGSCRAPTTSASACWAARP